MNVNAVRSVQTVTTSHESAIHLNAAWKALGCMQLAVGLCDFHLQPQTAILCGRDIMGAGPHV